MKFLVFFIGVLSFAFPSWFYNLSVKEDDLYIGYGVGKSIDEAKNSALKDIAEQISVVVESSYQKDVINYKKSLKQNLKISTSLRIRDYKILRLEKIGSEYYIAIGYKNISGIDILINRVKRLKLKESSNKFLNSTLLAKYIYSKVGKYLNFDIKFINGSWFICYEDICEILPKYWFEKLFINYGNRLKTNKKINLFKSGDIIKFSYFSLKDGYLSLYDITSKGEVYLLLKQKVKKGWNRLFLKDFDIQVFSDKKDFEMYVAVMDDNGSGFSNIYEANNNRDFGIFLKYLKGKEVNAVKITISPK